MKQTFKSVFYVFYQVLKTSRRHTLSPLCQLLTTNTQGFFFFVFTCIDYDWLDNFCTAERLTPHTKYKQTNIGGVSGLSPDHQYLAPGGYSLVWPIWGRAAGKGVVFGPLS